MNNMKMIVNSTEGLIFEKVLGSHTVEVYDDCDGDRVKVDEFTHNWKVDASEMSPVIVNDAISEYLESLYADDWGNSLMWRVASTSGKFLDMFRAESIEEAVEKAGRILDGNPDVEYLEAYFANGYMRPAFREEIIAEMGGQYWRTLADCVNA